ncbi:acyl-CoA N-acyltransferase [Jimgerdemannia flammicorona]|nr:acyl-CoA N-acyltransferase [Jimgerdemannia flammicorona]
MFINSPSQEKHNCTPLSKIEDLLAAYPLPSADLRLRQADPAQDIPVLTELVNSAYSVETGTEGERFKSVLRWVDRDPEDHFDKEGATIVLEKEGRIVGMVFLERDGPERCLFGPFAVDPSAQGKGYGQLLLALAEEVARAEPGVKTLGLHVANVRGSLINYYKRRGFEDTGEETDFPEEHKWRTTKPVKFVVLEKKL